MTGVKPYLTMLRPANSVLSAVGAVFAVLAYGGYTVSNPLLVTCAFITGFTLTGAAMLVNDVVDIDVDRINKPWKPLPSGMASPKVAIQIALALLTTGIACNLLVSPRLVLVATVYGALGVGYSFSRKYWWSSAIVAASTTGPVVYGYVAANTPTGNELFTSTFVTAVFLVTLGREFLKSIQDYRGDLEKGYRTIATVHGLNTARKAMLATGLGGAAIGYLTTLIPGVSTAYRAIMALAATFYTYSILKSYQRTKPEDLEKYRKRTLQAMTMGTLAFWLSKLPF